MRYFLDCEYNGFGGALLSLALVPEDGSEEFYATLACDAAMDAWVERHVVPYLDTVPTGLVSPRLSQEQAAMAVAAWIGEDPEPEIVVDWPEDIAYFCRLLTIGPGRMVPVPPITFRLVPMGNFSTAANSAVPHNALHDARSLRDYVTNHLEI